MKEFTMVKNWETSVISSYLQANNLASQFHVLCWDAQSCLTLCDPVNCSPPGFSGKKLMGFFHQEYMEWGAIFSSRGSFRPQRWNSFILCHLHCQAGFLPLAPPGKPSQFDPGPLALQVSRGWQSGLAEVVCKAGVYQSWETLNLGNPRLYWWLRQ